MDDALLEDGEIPDNRKTGDHADDQYDRDSSQMEKSKSREIPVTDSRSLREEKKVDETPASSVLTKEAGERK